MCDCDFRFDLVSKSICASNPRKEVQRLLNDMSKQECSIINGRFVFGEDYRTVD